MFFGLFGAFLGFLFFDDNVEDRAIPLPLEEVLLALDAPLPRRLSRVDHLLLAVLILICLFVIVEELVPTFFSDPPLLLFLHHDVVRVVSELFCLLLGLAASIQDLGRPDRELLSAASGRNQP